MTLGVQTSNGSAQAALQQNNVEATALIAALKAKGVADADIQTSDMSISPNWDNHGNITGYGVSNTVTVTLHDINTAGAIIDDAASKVGNDVRFQGVALSIDNKNPLLAQARAAAVKDALAQAQQLATAAGVKLGAVRTIDDTATTSPQPLYYSNKQALDGRCAREHADRGGLAGARVRRERRVRHRLLTPRGVCERGLAVPYTRP